MTTQGRRPVAVAALTASAYLLAACGSSGSTTHADTTNTAAVRTATSASFAPASPASATAGTPLTATSPTAHASSAAHHAADGRACTLITERDVTSAVGANPGKGSADERHGAGQCIYGSYRTQVLLVNVVRSQGNADYAHARTDPKLLQIPGTRVADITGLGERAFELFAPHTDALYFTKGDALIIVAFSTRTAPRKGAALALAKIAARRF